MGHILSTTRNMTHWPIWGPYIEMVMVPWSTPAIHSNVDMEATPTLRWTLSSSSARMNMLRRTSAMTIIPSHKRTLWTPFQTHVWYLVWTYVSISSNWEDSTSITSWAYPCIFDGILSPMSFGVASLIEIEVLGLNGLRVHKQFGLVFVLYK